MENIAYICSYETNPKYYSDDITSQKNEIKAFCKKNDILLSEIFIEDSEARDDFKPVLLNLMNDFYGHAKKIVVFSPDTISRNQNFLSWVQDELGRMKIELLFINNDFEKTQKIEQCTKLKELKNKIKNIPSLPEIITKSMEIMQNKNSSTEELSKVISTDIGLTARVLKLVNSAFYGFPKQISTINQAVVILGFTTIKGLILSASILRIFNTKDTEFFSYKKFWSHSILSAKCADLLSRELNLSEEDIFSAAFLHDIGKIILAQYDSENYQRACLKNKDKKSLIETENEECGTNHCEIGGIIAYTWNLPQIFCDIILYHHKPLQSENYKKACAIVHIADDLVNSIFHDKIYSVENIDEGLLEILDISEDNIDVIYSQIKEIADNIEDIDSIFK